MRSWDQRPLWLLICPEMAGSSNAEASRFCGEVHEFRWLVPMFAPNGAGFPTMESGFRPAGTKVRGSGLRFLENGLRFPKMGTRATIAGMEFRQRGREEVPDDEGTEEV